MSEVQQLRSYLSSTHKCHSQRVQLGQASKSVAENAGDGVVVEMSACQHMSDDKSEARPGQHPLLMHSQFLQLRQVGKSVAGNVDVGVATEVSACQLKSECECTNYRETANIHSCTYSCSS